MNAALDLAHHHLARARHHLATRGISVGGLARAVGCSRTAVYPWLSGRAAPASGLRKALLVVCNEYGLDPRIVAPALDIGDGRTGNLVNLDAHRPGRKKPLGRGGIDTPEDEEEGDEMPQTREYLEPQELEWFGLPADPFDDPDNPEDVYTAPHVHQVERVLRQALVRRQIVAIVGEPGSGKSTILRRWLAQAAREQGVRPMFLASVDRTKVNAGAIVTAILRDLLGTDKASSLSMEDRSILLQRTLQDADRSGVNPVLIVDEAHLLPAKALLGVKHVWDSHVLFRQLAVFLVGQPRLHWTLQKEPQVREVAGRTRVVTLPSLRDCRDYLRWRFARVGGDAEQVFAPGAYRMLGLAEYPLWINNRAVIAMRCAHQAGHRVVDERHVGQG